MLVLFRIPKLEVRSGAPKGSKLKCNYLLLAVSEKTTQGIKIHERSDKNVGLSLVRITFITISAGLSYLCNVGKFVVDFQWTRRTNHETVCPAPRNAQIRGAGLPGEVGLHKRISTRADIGYWKDKL